MLKHLKKLLISIEKKCKGDDNDFDGAIARLNQMQVGKQKLKSAVSCVLNKITVLTARLGRVSINLLMPLSTRCERMADAMVKVLYGKVIKSRNKMFEETKKTIATY